MHGTTLATNAVIIKRRQQFPHALLIQRKQNLAVCRQALADRQPQATWHERLGLFYNMASAVREHAVEVGKGLDGRTLIAIGGMAPLHGARLAAKLGLHHVIVPVGAGVGSALGFLRAPVSFEATRRVLLGTAQFDADAANAIAYGLIADLRQLVSSAASSQSMTEHRMPWMRYKGQGHEIRVAEPLDSERSILDAVRYNKLGVVHYALDGDIPGELEFSGRQSTTRIATRQQLPAAPQAGRSRAQLYCQLTPEAAEEAQRLGHSDSLDTLIRREIRQRIPRFDSRVHTIVNQWIPYKLPVFYPGYCRKVVDFLAWQSKERRSVYYCGGYLSQALLTGACARRIWGAKHARECRRCRLSRLHGR
ncbi:protein of unknown function [Cupriavidus taiwanensis]|nr:protein of unknown function [Cupriavidus taiwanensis]